MPTTAPAAPSTIKHLPIEYDQLINNLLDNIEYNAAQAKTMCFVTDSLGNITADAKAQMVVLATSIVDILGTFSDEPSNFAVYDQNLLGIFRPYYSNLNEVGMIQILGDLDFSNMVVLDATPSTGSTDEEFRDAWNAVIEYCGDNKRGA
jgi:hypothetical protein